jgi:hypothetical protein
MKPPATAMPAARGRKQPCGTQYRTALLGYIQCLIKRLGVCAPAGNATNTTFIEGGAVPLPVDNSSAWTLPNKQLGLSIWVDHTVLEVYALGGLARVTSRVYPEGDTADYGVAVFGGGPSSGSAGSGSSSGVNGALVLPTGGAGGGGGASVGADVQVWEVENMWLPPSC